MKKKVLGFEDYRNKEYTIDELIQHFRFVQQTAIYLGAMMTDEEVGKSWALLDKLDSLKR